MSDTPHLVITATGTTLTRLIVEWTDSDGCTYSCTNTLPVLYESAEAFAVEFEAWCKINASAVPVRRASTFAGQDFEAYHFFEEGVYSPPRVYTVEEWFQEQDSAHQVLPK